MSQLELARRVTRVALLCALFAVSSLHAQPARDTVSDGVGSTAGVFRVDESGSATYKISIAVPPGTAGVAPTLSLDYSSQGALGTMGKGWSLNGGSAIGRCRRTREHGDFYSGANPVDGDSLPVSLATTDAFCLDGQRLIKVGSGVYGDAATIYYPEIDPSTRVTAVGGNNSVDPSVYTGPLSFKVERKDGSVAEYGNTSDSRVERNQCGGSTGIACAVSVWALNRMEDSTGNYMTWHYEEYLSGTLTTAGTGADEYIVREVRYTGKRVLSGQTDANGQPAVATLPYARVLFNYSAAVAADRQEGWLAGSRLAQSRQLDNVKVQDPFSGTARTVRYYELGYVASTSNSGQRWLQSVKECNKGPGDTSVDAAQVCYPPTTFAQTSSKFQFNRAATSDITMDVSDRRGSRIGDVDGDGRMDLVWVKNVNQTGCTTSRIFVSYGDRTTVSGTSELTLATPAQEGVCVGRELGDLEDSWQLIDYDGDGRDDLMLAEAAGATARWRIHPSLGDPPSGSSSVFNTSVDLLDGIVIPVPAENRRLAQLVDFNGDGLLDVVYPVTVHADSGYYSVLRARLRERYLKTSPSTYALRFGAETTLSFDWTDFDSCPTQLISGPQREELPDGYQLSRCELSFAQSQEGRFIASDFDGDGRGDLMMKVYRRYTPDGGLIAPDEPDVIYVSEDEVVAREDEPTEGTGPQYTEHWYFFVSRANGTSTIRLEQYDMLPVFKAAALISGDAPGDASWMQLADFNADGLADLLYRRPDVSPAETFRLRHNRGFGFSPTFWDATGVKNPDFAQVADINGDGRSDLLYPPSTDSCAAEANSTRGWCVRYGQAQSMTLASAGRVPGAEAGTASSTLLPIDHEHYFADFDGDGAADYMRFKRANSNPKIYSTRSTTRHQARDVVAQITDGLGAITRLTHQPLTNASVYRRDAGSLTTPNPSGRGSPVHDMVAPVYVVAKAASSAPTWTDAAALAEITYRYAGARMQAGGRGFLGFREIASFDGAHAVSPAKHMVVRTRYRQDFPFIGHPDLTEKFAVSSAVTHGSTSIDACRGDPETLAQSCFYSFADASWPAQLGTKISNSQNHWSCKGKNNSGVCPIVGNPVRSECLPSGVSALATQQPIFPYLAGSVEDGFAFNTATTGNGTKLSATVSSFCHADVHDNLTQAKVERWDDTAPLSVQKTTNAYTNDTVAWRLGRLTQTDIETQRSCTFNSGLNTVTCSDGETRTSSFGYDLSGPKTGLLTRETVQPGGGADEELRTLHVLDGWGNRNASYVCSRFKVDGVTPLSDTECVNKDLVRHHLAGDPGLVTAVHRYTRTTFDAAGRYTTSTILPYYVAPAPGATDVVERVASAINGARDEFGNPTQVTDINGRVTRSVAGALGRPYYTDDGAGATRTTTYRWCAAVNCPPGAAFRSKSVSSVAGLQQLAPTSWTYHDVLGRPILVATEAFAAGISGSDFSAVCTYYDTKTRSERASDPAFLASTATGGEPSFGPAATPVDPCLTVNWSRMERDVLGRTTKSVAPDGSETTFTYTGLESRATDPLGTSVWELKNALGEVVKMTQASPTNGGTKGMEVDSVYDSQGRLHTVTRNAGQGVIVTTYGYDVLGRRTTTVDPDRGTETAAYNAAGDVIRTIDGQGLDVRFDIDALGRIWRRHSGKAASGTEPPAQQVFGDGFELPNITAPGSDVDTWLYDSLSTGRGQLTFEERVSPNEATYRRNFTYDGKGRIGSRVTLIDGTSYSEAFAYDALGRAYRYSDVSTSSNTVETTYTNRGFADTLRNASTTAEVYQDVSEMNARGQVTSEQRGPASVTRGYHPTRGWLTSIQAGNSNSLQNLSYTYNALGNVTQRRDIRSNQTEVPAYDSLHRLKTLTATVGGNAPQVVLSLTYDALGNICSKAGQTYTYAGRDGCNVNGTAAGSSPHAVTSIGTTTYGYTTGGLLDAALVPGQSSQDRYFAFDGLQNLALVVVGNLALPSAEIQFKYGPAGERYLRRETVAGSTTVTRTIGNVERIARPSGVIETKRYIAGVLIETRFSDTTPTTKRTLLPDGLGSMDTVVSEGGAAHERLSFDGHGTRRNAADWRVPLTSYTPQNSTDGFTGHEHLDTFGLIHMNGRVYDPKMGRFIQADPLIDAGVQGLNRYSYVLNNPLSLTDPTGHMSDRWEQALRTVAAIVITYYSGGAAAGAGGWAGAGIASAGGFAAGAVQTGTMKGGLYGAFSAALFYGIGSTYQSVAAEAGTAGTVGKTGLTSTQLVGKSFMHGIAGGVMSDLQGGKFGHGFVSAGVTQAVSPQINEMSGAGARIVAAAALGGTVSAATGGKFANGAITAAFSRAFNDGAHERATQKVRHFTAEGTVHRRNAEAAEQRGTFPEGDIVYVGHGSSIALQNDNELAYGRPVQMYGEDVVADLRAYAAENGIEIRDGMTLVAAWCNSGVEPGSGWTNISQFIANELNWNVVSTTASMQIYPDGAITVHPLVNGVPDTSAPGGWVTTKPKGE